MLFFGVILFYEDVYLLNMYFADFVRYVFQTKNTSFLDNIDSVVCNANNIIDGAGEKITVTRQAGFPNERLSLNSLKTIDIICHNNLQGYMYTMYTICENNIHMNTHTYIYKCTTYMCVY